MSHESTSSQRSSDHENILIHHAPEFRLEIDIPFHAPLAPGEDTYGVHYLLADNQTLIGTKNLSYCRRAVKFLSSKGVEQFSQVTAEFDPSYQRIVWHAFGVWRNGTFRPQLSPERVEVARRERGMERNMYDKRLTHFLIPHDVRSGDVLEYAYSIVGNHPSERGQFSDIRSAQWGVPVARVHCSYQYDDDRELRSKVMYSKGEFQRCSVEGNLCLRFDAENIHAAKGERDAPSWFSEQPITQISQFRNWRHVADHVCEGFYQQQTDSPEVNKFADYHRKRAWDKPRLARELVDFVQNEIRYVHLGGGHFSVTPYNSEKVFTQRFGDCKDKSLLLVTLLRAVGFEAHVALVLTEGADDLPEVLPAPHVFDHAVVRMKLDEKELWIDATMSRQYGPVESRQFPDYRYALILDDDQNDFVPIPYEGKPSSVLVKERYHFDTFGRPATLSVSTTFNGTLANSIREQFEDEAISEIQERYLDAYRHEFQTLSQGKPIECQDNPQENSFRVIEEYTIDVFPNPASWFVYKAYAYPRDLLPYIHRPDIPSRKTPLAVTYPLQYDHEICLTSDRKQNYNIGGVYTIDCPYFAYHCDFTSDERIATYTFSYRSKRKVIESDQIDDYNEKLREMWNKGLYWQMGNMGHGQTIVSILFGLLALALFFGAKALIL